MSSDSENTSSDSSSNAEERLGDQIVKKLQRSAFDKKVFLPEGCIHELITKTAVVKELAFTKEEMEKESSTKLLKFIMEKGPKIFAITLLAGYGFPSKDLRKAMNHFRRSSFGDESLPVMDETKSNHPFFGESPKSPWGAMSILNFCDKQWAFLAPVFSEKRLNLQLNDDDILPFTCQDNDVKSGAFGEVHQVTVHPSHYQNPVLTVSILVYGFYLLIHYRTLISDLISLMGNKPILPLRKSRSTLMMNKSFKHLKANGNERSWLISISIGSNTKISSSSSQPSQEENITSCFDGQTGET